MMRTRTNLSVIVVALLAGMTVLSAQPAGGRGGGGRGGRFKIYPAEAVNRGLPAYNSTCGYCHGERGKGGQAGPDLIFFERHPARRRRRTTREARQRTGTLEGRQDRGCRTARWRISPPTCIRA